MGYLNSFLYEFKNTYTREEQLITLLFSSIFFPYQLMMVCYIISFIYIVYQRDVFQIISKMKGAKLIFLFCLYLMVVSILVSNWLGLLLSIGLFICFVCITYYRYFISKRVFESILNIVLILSIVALVYCIFEQFYYMSLVDGMTFFDIQNSPSLRVRAFFYNASYYALMILFIENICVYKFFNCKTRSMHVYYTCIGLLNLFALYLTGSRTPWLCLAISVLIMLIIQRWYKLFVSAIGFVLVSLGALSLKPDLLPRLVSQGLDVARRVQIWNSAKLMIEDCFIFGRGPLSYYTFYESYTEEYIATYGLESYEQYKLGISSQHSHTILYEGFISFGIIGSIMLLMYTWIHLKMVVMIIYKKINVSFAALVVGVLVSALTSSIIDFPLLWLQTGTFMYMILGTCDIYKKEINL